jgi:hypothetical protein
VPNEVPVPVPSMVLPVVPSVVVMRAPSRRAP